MPVGRPSRRLAAIAVAVSLSGTAAAFAVVSAHSDHSGKPSLAAAARPLDPGRGTLPADDNGNQFHISTTQGPGTSGPVGSNLTDFAQVVDFKSADNTKGLTGFAVFELFMPSMNPCGMDSSVATETVALTPTIIGGRSAGTASTQLTHPATATGVWHWRVSFEDSTGTIQNTTGCDENWRATTASPSITTDRGVPTQSENALMSDTATVTGGFNPTGTVTFQLFKGSCTAANLVFTSAGSGVPLTNGTASDTAPAQLATGTYNWVATYNGDSNNSPVSSNCGDETVTLAAKAIPVVTTDRGAATQVVGGTLSDTATVTGSTPTGNVTFTLFSDNSCGNAVKSVTNVPLSNGTAMAGLNNIAPGTYYWVAFYLGDTNNLPERSGCADEKVTVIQATPKIATRTKPSSALQGALLSDTAKVSGGDNPTGTVTFELFSPDDKTCSGKPAFTSQPVNLVGGSASVTSTVEAKQIGTWHWVAIYSGDTDNASVQTGCRAEPVRITAPPPPIPQTQPHHHHASCAASRDPNCDPWRNF